MDDACAADALDGDLEAAVGEALVVENLTDADGGSDGGRDIALGRD
jgi:hypothetical protein